MPKMQNLEVCLERLLEVGDLSIDEAEQLSVAVAKAKIFDTLLPLLQRGDTKGLEKLRQKLLRQRRAVARVD
jgi:hypothetical protein